MKKQWTVVASAFLVASAALGEEHICQLHKGKFERRSALIAEGGAYRREPSDSTASSKELESINEEYFQFMSRVSNGVGQNGAESECCTGNIEDPIAKIVCKFARYLSTERKEHRLLLESVPNEPTGREALWALDPIAFFHAEQDPENIPALFKPSGPVALYLDELYRLVRMGDKEALSKYLELYFYSDGEHAEAMDDQMEKLFSSQSDLVLRQWDVFKHHRKALQRFITFLPDDEKRLLRPKIDANKECAVHSEACSELKTLLNFKTPVRE